MKKIICIIIMLLFLLSASLSFAAVSKPPALSIFLNGKYYDYDQNSLVAYRDLLIPKELIKTSFGADLVLGGEAGSIKISKGRVKLVISLKNRSIELNNMNLNTGFLPREINSAQLISIIAQTLGYKSVITNRGITLNIVTVNDTEPPEVPGEINTFTISTSQINLKWSESRDNIFTAGYKVFRNGIQIATVTEGTSFYDTGLDSGTVYKYSVAAFDASGNISEKIEAEASTYTAINNGSGLTGEYFGDVSYINLLQTRIDPFINFDWESGFPAALEGNKNCSVRWRGQLIPTFTGEFTFHTVSTGVVNLYVNGVKILSKNSTGAKKDSWGRIRLIAGEKTDIRLDFSNSSDTPFIKLLWSVGYKGEQIIPQSQLIANGISPLPQ